MNALYPWTRTLLSPMIAAAAMASSSVAVVTNALRLRGYKRPESAQEILHPPLGDRVREVGYLVSIGLVALAIGAGSFWASSRIETHNESRSTDHPTTEEMNH